MPPSASSPIDQEYNVNNNEQPIHHYAVGDVGKPEHMADNDSHDNIILAAAHLKPNDLCFVLRSNGQYTYAKVKSCRLGPKAHIELQVDDVGCLKRIPLHLCWKYVRQMSASMQLAQLQAQEQESPPQETQHESERAAGLPAPPSVAGAASSAPSLLSSNYQPRRRSAQRNVETFTRSFRGAQGLPQRRSSLRKGFSSNPDFSVGVAQQRLSLEALHLESQVEEVGLDLDEPQPRPTRGLTKTSQSTANLMGFGLSGSTKQESLSSFSKESVLSRDNNNNKKNFKSSITIDHRQLNEELNMALFGLTL